MTTAEAAGLDTVNRVATKHGAHRTVLLEAAALGHLKLEKIGGILFVERAEAERYLASRVTTRARSA